MSRRTRQQAAPLRSAGLVDRIFERAGLAEEAHRWRVIAAWGEAAGPRLAANARAERFHGDTLIVRVKSSAWAQQLSMMRAELLTRLRAIPDCAGVRELRYSIGPLDDLPMWTPEPRPEIPSIVPGPAPLPIEDGYVTAALLQVTDLQLRAGLAELYARCRRRR